MANKKTGALLRCHYETASPVPEPTASGGSFAIQTMEKQRVNIHPLQPVRKIPAL